MKIVSKEYFLFITGAANAGRDTAQAVGTVLGSIAGDASRIPNGGIYGGAAGGFIGGQAYDAISSLPPVPFPNANLDPANHWDMSGLLQGFDFYKEHRDGFNGNL